MDKILKGTKPAEITVEVNPKIEFVINLQTAKTLGLTIAPEVLFRPIGSSADPDRSSGEHCGRGPVDSGDVVLGRKETK